MAEQAGLEEMIENARLEVSPFFNDPFLETLADRMLVRYLSPNSAFEQMIVGQYSHGALLRQENGRNVLLLQPVVGYPELRRVMFKAYHSLMNRDFVADMQAKKTTPNARTPAFEARELLLLESLPFAFEFCTRRAQEEAQKISFKGSLFSLQLKDCMSFYFTTEYNPSQPAAENIQEYIRKIGNQSIEGDISISETDIAMMNTLQFDPAQIDFLRRKVSAHRSKACAAARDYAIMFAATIFEREDPLLEASAEILPPNAAQGEHRRAIRVSFNYPENFKLESSVARMRISDLLGRNLYASKKYNGLTPAGDESLYEIIKNTLDGYLNKAKSRAIELANTLR